MKVFVIILLSFGIIRGLVNFTKEADEHHGPGIVASLLIIASYILAVVFACKI